MGYHLTTLQQPSTKPGKSDHANQILTVHKHVLRRLRQLVLIFMATTKREQEQEQVCNLAVEAVKEFGEKGIDSALSAWALEAAQAAKGSFKLGDAEAYYSFRVVQFGDLDIDIEESLLAPVTVASLVPQFFDSMSYCMRHPVSANPNFDYLDWIK